MPRPLTLLAAVTLLVWASSAKAAPGILDLIPDDAEAALMIRGIAELEKKGDKLIADAAIDRDIQPSAVFKKSFDWLGIQNGVDKDRPAGIIFVHGKYGAKGGEVNGWNDMLKRLVLVIPFTDRDKMGGNFKLKAGDLRPDKVLKTTAAIVGPAFVSVRDKCLLMGITESAVKSVGQSKPLAKTLSAQQVRALENEDILLYVSPAALMALKKTEERDWKKLWKEIEDRAEAEKDSDVDPVFPPAFRRQLFPTLAEIQGMFVTARIDEGLHVRALATFPKKLPDNVRQFLSGPQGAKASDLTALPDAPALAAQAARGDETQNAALLVLLDALLEPIGDEFLGKRNRISLNRLIEQLAPSQRLTIVGVVAELWKQLHGHRAALYRNADPAKHGQVGMAAILDTGDAEKFLGEVKQLARFAGAAAIDLSDKPEAKDDVQTVKQLIRDLDNDRFSVRQSATLKLELIGEPTVPYLDAVLKNKPPLEVLRRIETIKERISTAAQERRKGLLSDAGRRLQPSFSYVAKAETREGVPIDVLHIKLSDQDLPATKQLRYLFGPHWDKVRVAVHGKQVVIVWGSDGNLMSAALRNLKEKKPGLAAAKPLFPFAQTAEPGRQMELHVSLQAILGFLKAEDIKLPAAQAATRMSSLALTVDLDRVQFDLDLPTAELKAIHSAAQGVRVPLESPQPVE